MLRLGFNSAELTAWGPVGLPSDSPREEPAASEVNKMQFKLNQGEMTARTATHLVQMHF